MNAIAELILTVFWGTLALLKIGFYLGLYCFGFATMFFCLYIFYIVLAGA